MRRSMSKASAWAARRKEIHDARPAPLSNVPNETYGGQFVGVSVTDDGRACLTTGAQTIWLTEDAARRVGCYLLDTFGEEPTS